MAEKTYISQSVQNTILARLDSGIYSKFNAIGGQRGVGVVSDATDPEIMYLSGTIEVTKQSFGGGYNSILERSEMPEIYNSDLSPLQSAERYDDETRYRGLVLRNQQEAFKERYKIRRYGYEGLDKQNLASDSIFEAIGNDRCEKQFYNTNNYFKYIKIDVSSSLNPKIKNTIRIGSHPLQVNRNFMTPIISGNRINKSMKMMGSYFPDYFVSNFGDSEKGMYLAPMDMIYCQPEKGLDEFSPGYEQLPRIFVPDGYITGSDAYALGNDKYFCGDPDGGRNICIFRPTVFDISLSGSSEPKAKYAFIVSESNIHLPYKLRHLEDFITNHSYKYVYSGAKPSSQTSLLGVLSDICVISPNDYFQRAGKKYSLEKKFYYEFNNSSSNGYMSHVIPQAVTVKSAYPFHLTVNFANETASIPYIIKRKSVLAPVYLSSIYGLSIIGGIDSDFDWLKLSGPISATLPFFNDVYQSLYGINCGESIVFTNLNEAGRYFNYGLDLYGSGLDAGKTFETFQVEITGNLTLADNANPIFNYCNTSSQYILINPEKSSEGVYNGLSMYYSGFFNTQSFNCADYASASIDMTSYPTMSIRVDWDVPFNKKYFLGEDGVDDQKISYKDSIDYLYRKMVDRSQYDYGESLFRTSMIAMDQRLVFRENSTGSWSDKKFEAPFKYLSGELGLADAIIYYQSSSFVPLRWTVGWQSEYSCFTRSNVYGDNVHPQVYNFLPYVYNENHPGRAENIESYWKSFYAWSDNYGDAKYFPNARVIPGIYPFRESFNTIKNRTELMAATKDVFRKSPLERTFQYPAYLLTASISPDCYYFARTFRHKLQNFDFSEMKSSEQEKVLWNQMFRMVTASTYNIQDGIEGNYGFVNYIKNQGSLEELGLIKFKAASTSSVDFPRPLSIDNELSKSEIRAHYDIMKNSCYTIFLQYPMSLANIVPISGAFALPTKFEFSPVTYSFSVNTYGYEQINMSPDAPALMEKCKNREISTSDYHPYTMGTNGYSFIFTNLDGSAPRKLTGSMVVLNPITSHSIPRQDMCCFGSLTYKRVQMHSTASVVKLDGNFNCSKSGTIEIYELSGNDMRIANRAHIMGRKGDTYGGVAFPYYTTEYVDQFPKYIFDYAGTGTEGGESSIGTAGYFNWAGNEYIDPSNDYTSENPLTRTIAFPYVDFYQHNKFDWIMDAVPAASSVVLYQGNCVFEHDQFRHSGRTISKLFTSTMDTRYAWQPDNHFVNLPVVRMHFADLNYPEVMITHLTGPGMQHGYINTYTSSIQGVPNNAPSGSHSYIAKMYMFRSSGYGTFMFDESGETKGYDEYAKLINHRFNKLNSEFGVPARMSPRYTFGIGDRNIWASSNTKIYPYFSNSNTVDNPAIPQFKDNPFAHSCEFGRNNRAYYMNHGFGQFRHLLEGQCCMIQSGSKTKDYTVRVVSSSGDNTTITFYPTMSFPTNEYGNNAAYPPIGG